MSSPEKWGDRSGTQSELNTKTMSRGNRKNNTPGRKLTRSKPVARGRSSSVSIKETDKGKSKNVNKKIGSKSDKTHTTDSGSESVSSEEQDEDGEERFEQQCHPQR